MSPLLGAVNSRRARGLSLGVVLILAMLMLLVGFTIAEISTFQLQAANRARYSAEALELAEGAIAETLEALHSGIPAIGTALQNGTTLPLPYGSNQEQIQFPPTAADADPWGRVVFNPNNTYGLKGACLPYSTANANGKTSTGYQGSSVPTGAYDVLATGQSHGVTRTVEVTITIPSYPFAIASAGPLTVSGDLVVVGVHDLQHALDFMCANQTVVDSEPAILNYSTQGLITTLAEGLTTGIPIPSPSPTMVTAPIMQPASIYLGGTASFGSNLTVNGDVVWSGATPPSLPTTSVPGSPFQVVSGKVLNGTVPLPTLPPFDVTQVTSGAISDLPDNPQSPYYVYSSSECPVTIYSKNNGLSLKSTVVYVDGDITVNGSVTGTGAIIATGTITINCSGPWDAGDAVSTYSVTLIGGTGVTIKGAAGVLFKGYIYSPGPINLSNVYILGAVIGEPGGAAAVNLTNAWVVYIPPGPGQSVRGSDLFSGVPTNPVTGASLPSGDFFANQTAAFTMPVLLEVQAAMMSVQTYPLPTSIPTPVPIPVVYTDISGAFAFSKTLTVDNRRFAVENDLGGGCYSGYDGAYSTPYGLGLPSQSNFQAGQNMPSEAFGGFAYQRQGRSDTIQVYDVYYDSTHNVCLLQTPDVVTYQNGTTSETVGQFTSDVAGVCCLTATAAPNVAAIDTAFFRAMQTNMVTEANVMLQSYPATVLDPSGNLTARAPFVYMNPDPVTFLPDAPVLSITAWREK